MREVLLKISTPLILIISLVITPSCSDITNISTEQLNEQIVKLDEPESNRITGNKQFIYKLNDEIISSRFIKRIKLVYIDSISILRDEEAIQFYGEDGKNGIVEIFADEKIFTDLKPDTTKINLQ